jgi:hypothetical protein
MSYLCDIEFHLAISIHIDGETFAFRDGRMRGRVKNNRFRVDALGHFTPANGRHGRDYAGT